MKRTLRFAGLAATLAATTLSFSTRAYAADDEPAPTTAPTPPADPAPADPAPAAPTEQPAPAAAETAPAAAPEAPLGAAAPTNAQGRAKDTVVPAASDKADAKPKERRFAGTQLFMQAAAVNLNTFDPALQQTKNPTVETSLFVLPRMRINDDFQLRGRVIASYEWTNSDTTTKRNELRFGDATLQLFYRSIPTFAGIKPMVAAQLALPLSPESQSRTMIVSPGLLVQLSRGFEHVLGGDAMLIANASYSHPIYSQTTAVINGASPYPRQCFADNTCSNQLTGAANVSDSLNWSVIAAMEWGKWSPAAFFLMSHAFPYSFKDLPGVDRVASRPSVRQSTYFSFWLDYNANSYFTAEVGYFMSRSLLNADGSYGNPFFDNSQDMRVYLGANFNIDNFVKSLSGGDADGGVVRAKNTHRAPVMAF
ncbi:MAG: hypothetical protein U0169_27255 [Polyangiaceae bacterium]